MCSVVVKLRLFKAYCSSFYCSNYGVTTAQHTITNCNLATIGFFHGMFRVDRCSITKKCVELNIDCFKVL